MNKPSASGPEKQARVSALRALKRKPAVMMQTGRSSE